MADLSLIDITFGRVELQEEDAYAVCDRQATEDAFRDQVNAALRKRFPGVMANFNWGEHATLIVNLIDVPSGPLYDHFYSIVQETIWQVSDSNAYWRYPVYVNENADCFANLSGSLDTPTFRSMLNTLLNDLYTHFEGDKTIEQDPALYVAYDQLSTLLGDESDPVNTMIAHMLHGDPAGNR